jgi:hypothetical protein
MLKVYCLMNLMINIQKSDDVGNRDRLLHAVFNCTSGNTERQADLYTSYAL